MAEEVKKISFSFANSIKKPALKNVVPQEEKKVDYIECLDEKNIKVIGEKETKDEPLVIPLLGSRTWHDRIVNKIDADIFEPKTIKEEVLEDTDKKHGEPELSNGNTSPKPIAIKTEPIEDDDNKVVTLEEQAAKEIIEDLKSKKKDENNKNEFTLPLIEDQSLRGQEQSTLEDYEKIPIDAFGLAMLRGMGWKPGKGIGKNQRIVPAVVPELRPKGMGLGADKVSLQKKATDSKKPEEELKIEKGSFVKIIAGKQSNNYGQIEGLDDDAGRLIIKLALTGNTISVNEFMVQPVTKLEFSKNSKVLNVKKYEEYKEKQSKDPKLEPNKNRSELSDQSFDSERNDESSDVDKAKKRNKVEKAGEKKSRNRKRHSETDSDNDSDQGKRRRRERSNSSSSEPYRSKKSKKSKKHKKYDYSPERSSKKNKKKDKEREKNRDKKSRDYTDRKKHKKRGRSRSRSRSSSRR